MNVSILIGTFGSDDWRDLAYSYAYPTAAREPAEEVLIDHEPDGTIASARNRIAVRAVGDWLCFLDADDELCPGYLAAMETADDISSYLRDPLLLAPALCEAFVDMRPKIPNRGGWPKVNECCIGTLIPRSLFLEIGGFRETTDDGTPLTLYEDFDLFLRACDAGARIVHVPDATYCAQTRSGGRNQGADALRVYSAIWRDHEARERAWSSQGIWEAEA